MDGTRSWDGARPKSTTRYRARKMRLPQAARSSSAASPLMLLPSRKSFWSTGMLATTSASARAPSSEMPLWDSHSPDSNRAWGSAFVSTRTPSSPIRFLLSKSFPSLQALPVASTAATAAASGAPHPSLLCNTRTISQAVCEALGLQLFLERIGRDGGLPPLSTHRA
eukprot:scaffold318080_cov30-Tisochrysis_lutea.AAC.1